MAGRLDDGFSTTIGFADNPNVKFFEKEVSPPGADAGGEIDTSTMLNTLYRTKNPKSLITMTPISLTAAYEVSVYTDIMAMLGNNQLITITFPDGGTVAVWGWVDSFTPGALVEGDQPTAEIEIIISNQDASGDEIAPAITPSA